MGQKQEGGPRAGLELGLELRWGLSQGRVNKTLQGFLLLCSCIFHHRAQVVALCFTERVWNV